MKTLKTLTLLTICLMSIALADDFKTVNGKEYKNARVSRIEPDGVVLITKVGISKVYFTEFPKEVQQRFHYNAEKVSEFHKAAEAAVAQSNAAAAEQLQLQQQKQRRKVAQTAPLQQ